MHAKACKPSQVEKLKEYIESAKAKRYAGRDIMICDNSDGMMAGESGQGDKIEAAAEASFMDNALSVSNCACDKTTHGSVSFQAKNKN